MHQRQVIITKITKDPDMEFDELSRKVIGCALEVHRNLGPSLLESTYRQCLACEPIRRKFLRTCDCRKFRRLDDQLQRHKVAEWNPTFRLVALRALRVLRG